MLLPRVRETGRPAGAEGSRSSRRRGRCLPGWHRRSGLPAGPREAGWKSSGMRGRAAGGGALAVLGQLPARLNGVAVGQTLASRSRSHRVMYPGARRCLCAGQIQTLAVISGRCGRRWGVLCPCGAGSAKVVEALPRSCQGKAPTWPHIPAAAFLEGSAHSPPAPLTNRGMCRRSFPVTSLGLWNSLPLW